MTQPKQFKVKIWGSRGSYPKPGKSTIRYGGNTTCVEVTVGNCHTIFDAGTGIIELGKELKQDSIRTEDQLLINLFFTHTHYDHIEGFPFFEPAYCKSSIIHIFGPRAEHVDLYKTLSRTMFPPYFPVKFSELMSSKSIYEINDTDRIDLCSVSGKPVSSRDNDANHIVIDVLQGTHHPGSILIYSATWMGKKMVFATDTEGLDGGDERLIAFARNADLLIHDAHFTSEGYNDPAAPKKGWGHSTVDMAVEVAQKANVKRLVLFHHAPEDTDDVLDEKLRYAQQIFPNTSGGYEGETFYL